MNIIDDKVCCKYCEKLAIYSEQDTQGICYDDIHELITDVDDYCCSGFVYCDEFPRS